MRRLMNMRQRLHRSAATTILILIAITMVLLSPLALPALDDQQRDWERLSLIGESYGAISAVLGASAVVAVALTLVIQQRQLRDTRQLAIRQFHTELLTMAIQDPELLKAWGDFNRPDGVEPKLVVYTNLVLNYFILLHETGSATSDEIRLHLRFMATSEWVRAYWASTADIWRTGHAGSTQGIVDLISNELSTPTSDPAPQNPQEQPD
jgi:hypothetical protein